MPDKRTSLLLLPLVALLASVLFSGCSAVGAHAGGQSNINALTGSSVTPYQFIIGTPVLNYMKSNNNNNPNTNGQGGCAGAITALATTQPMILMQQSDSLDYNNADPTYYPGAVAGKGYTTIEGWASTWNWSPIYVIRFSSEMEMARQFAAGDIPLSGSGKVTWIMYDNEANTSPITPTPEQNDPVKYYKLAGTLIHNNSLLFFGTAGLYPALNPDPEGYPEPADLYSISYKFDAYDVQSQTAEGSDSPAQFRTHILNVAANFINPTVTPSGPGNNNLIVAAGIGDFTGTPVPSPYPPTGYIPPTIVAPDPYGVESYLPTVFPGPPHGRAPVWGNFGPNSGTGLTAMYGDFCQIIADTATNSALAPTAAQFNPHLP